MKRFFTALLVLAMLLCLCACKSEEAKNAEALIVAIGTVSLDSEAALSAAEDAYNALSEEDKASIENYDLLTSARNAFDVMSVETQIAAIGDITLDSGAVITAAEAAYDALSEENKALVANASILTDARAKFDAAVHHEEVRQSIIGTWVNEAKGDHVYNLILEDTNCYANLCQVYDNEGNLIFEQDATTFQILEDGSFQVDEDPCGVWELSEDTSTVTLTVTLGGAASDPAVFSLIEEGGYAKLAGSLPNCGAFGYVRTEEYEAAFAEKFVVASLTAENVRDYLGDPVDLGNMEASGKTLQHCHVFPSQVYDDGLVYLGCSCYVNCTGTHKGKSITITSYFPVIGGWTDNVVTTGIGNNASGEMYYIKAEYVADNFIDEEGYRTLVLTNGVTLRFDGYVDYLDLFWSNVDANYEDYIY